MTDKQIIIDGVDVSGCRAYYKEYYITDMCSLADGLTCKENPNCDYKQLKRQERRCKMWEDIAVDNGELVLKYQQQLDQPKAENEELKDLNTRLDNQRETYWKGYQKLKATITEIKEIAEICKCHNTDGCYECKYFDDCEVEDEEIPTRDVCKLILQKIKEVEDENNRKI